MHRLSLGLLVLAGSLGAFAQGAGAYNGTLELSIGTLPTFRLPGAGDGVSTPSGFEIPAPANFTTFSISVPVTNATNRTFPAFPIVSLALTGPAGLTRGSFQRGDGPQGGIGGNAPLIGNARIGLFGPPPFAFLTVPLDVVGVEGATVMASSDLGVSVTVFGGGWTTGSVKVVGTTGPFDGVTLASDRGTEQRGPLLDGFITLVSPTLVRTNVAGSENIPLVSRLVLTSLIPEPGTALLLGVGVLGLALRARGRERA